MKKLLFLLFICSNLLFCNDFAKTYNYETNYKKAIKKAKKQKKDIVLVLVSQHCPWCDRLKEDVLSTEYTNEIIQKHYIPLILDSYQDKYPNRFNTKIVPTIHFVNYKNESIIETIIGFNANYRFYEIIEEKSEN